MKIVTAQEMARIEALAYQRGFSEEEFMNRAGQGVAEHAKPFLSPKEKVTLLCGKGNNGGDAYVAACILHEQSFVVEAFALAPLNESSRLCQLQAERFQKSGGKIHFIKSAEEIRFDGSNLIIDGLLGTGFRGSLEGTLKEVIEKANCSQIPTLSIDIPSGINGTTGEVGGIAIRAEKTLFLGLPKAGCFYDEAWGYVGRVSVFNFGLEEEFIDQAEALFFHLEEDFIAKHLPPIKRTRHKYQAGYVVGVGGSPGMPGAAILSSFATLRSGAGIVRLLHPEGMEEEFAGAPYELIRQGYASAKEILEAAERASSLFIGPGMGTHRSTEKILHKILGKLQKPCVIDAEALTLLARGDFTLPKETILTPHRGEMQRLLHRELSFSDLLRSTQEFVDKHKTIVVLKGAPTFIFHPHEKPFICSRGDPGMATAGSGDVLTGVIAAFLAQKASALEAAQIGVYLHALAGEIAAKTFTSYSVVASDITDALPQALQYLLSCENRGTRQ